MSKFKIRITL